MGEHQPMPAPECASARRPRRRAAVAGEANGPWRSAIISTNDLALKVLLCRPVAIDPSFATERRDAKDLLMKLYHSPGACSMACHMRWRSAPELCAEVGDGVKG